MCGRYVLAVENWQEFSELCQHLHDNPFQSYDVRPATSVPIVRSKRSTDRPSIEMSLALWWLIPSWAKGVKPTYATFNCKVENIETATTWKMPWRKSQRCLIPANSFYEWHLAEDGTTQKINIRAVDQDLFCFAGLWEASPKEDGESVISTTIILMPANKLMAHVHNSEVVKGKRVLRADDNRRMPAILHRQDWHRWLTTSPEEAMKLLVPYPDELLEFFEVKNPSKPDSSDATLIEPRRKWSAP